MNAYHVIHSKIKIKSKCAHMWVAPSEILS